MSRGRRTPPAKAGEAVAIADILGVDEAAKQTGVSVRTIYELRKRPEFAQLRSETQEDVAGDMWAGFQLGLQRITELLPLTTDISKVAITTAILFDKYALLTGGATARTEHRDLDDVDADTLALFEAGLKAESERAGLVVHSNGHGAKGADALSALSLPTGPTGQSRN